MARQPRVAQPKKIIVVDTSYLLELFAVPGFSNGRGRGEVKERFR